MYTVFFTAIKDLINTELPAIKTVDWYNNQFSKQDKLKAIQYPACLVEFENPINWEQVGRNNQTANTFIRLHLGHTDLSDGPEKIMTLSQKLYLAIGGKRLMNGDEQLSTELTRSATRKEEHGQFKVMILTFDTELWDCSAQGITQLHENVDLVVGGNLSGEIEPS